MIFCGRPPKNILEEALAALEEKFTLATPEWVTMENRWRTRSPSVGMKSQRPNRAMLWGERNSSETSSRSTTSARRGIPCPKVEEGPEEPSENLNGPVL